MHTFILTCLYSDKNYRYISFVWSLWLLFSRLYVLNRITLLSLSEVKAPGFVVGQVCFQSFELLWDVLLIYVYHVKSIKVSKVGSV